MIGKIQPYQAPTINRVAPKDRENRWPLVKDVAEPFAGNPASDTFGFWFNYFWTEVQKFERISVLQQQKAAEMFFAVFEGAKAPFTVRADFAARDDAFRENVLRQLLLIGFKRVALDAPAMTVRSPGSKALAPAPLVASDAQAMNLKILEGAKRGPTPIAFRADGRSYDDLIQHKGFRARARSDDSPIYAWNGFNKAWHPFNNPVYRNSMFLRLGSKNADNCLQTVISVGAEFAGVTHFPILNDYVLVFQAKSLSDGRFLALKPLGEWTPQDMQAAKAHSQKVRVVRDATGAIDHLEKDNYIYAFLMDGVKVFNTEQFFRSHGHTPFPERGANAIPLENLLCEVHFVQKWYYSTADKQIMLYELAFDPIRWLPSKPYVDVVIGAQGRQELEAIMLKEIARARGRTDITGEQVKFARQRSLHWTPLEREQAARALAAYLKQAKPKLPNGTNEKKAVVLALPALDAKVDAMGPVEWKEIRELAKQFA
ncbi:MAG: hypothetical protein ACOVRP_01715 [Gemmatimonas sp.]